MIRPAFPDGTLSNQPQSRNGSSGHLPLRLSGHPQLFDGVVAVRGLFLIPIVILVAFGTAAGRCILLRASLLMATAAGCDTGNEDFTG